MDDNRPYNFFCQIYLPHFRHTSAAAPQCQTTLEFSYNKRGKITLWMFRWSHCGAAERQLVGEMTVGKHSVISCHVHGYLSVLFFNDMPYVIFIFFISFFLHYSFYLISSSSFFSSFMLPLTFSVTLSSSQSLSPTCPPP